MRLPLILLRAALWLTPIAVASSAGAQPEPTLDDATRNAARDLAHRGMDAYRQGDYRTAQDLFHRSYALVPAPTLSLREARALEKLGRWIEAMEAYVRTTRTPLDESSPQAFREAVQAATQELGLLGPRIPRLIVQVSGADSSLRVELDGKPLPAALLGVEVPVDPGQRRITARTASASAEATPTLVEGGRQHVTLTLAPNAPAAPAAPTARAETSGASFEQRAWAVVLLGVGAAALSAGAVTGLLAANRHEDAERSCPGNRCERGSDGEDDLNAFRDLRTVSTVAYVVGAAAAGTGAALWLTASPRPVAGRVVPYVVLGGAGMRGHF